MGPNNRTNGQKRRPSFIEEARRRQIVETAIRTIAERGSSQTTLAEIAKDAGISKGVISYHFESKDELLAEVLAALVTQPAEFIKARVDAESSARGKLGAYVDAFFAYLPAHRADYVALVDLWGSAGASAGREQFNVEAYRPSRHYLVKILEAGRAGGEFRDLPVLTVASVIQGLIDGVMLQWVFDEAGVDLDACRAEIQAMVARHVSGVPDDDNSETTGRGSARKRGRS